METTKIRCTCSCHQPGNHIMHIMACCNNGWIEQPILKQYVKDGEWFRSDTNAGTLTWQYSELMDGKIEIDPSWEISDEELGRVYIIKPEKGNENNSEESST
jgi:hypothetical protein